MVEPVVDRCLWAWRAAEASAAGMRSAAAADRGAGLVVDSTTLLSAALAAEAAEAPGALPDARHAHRNRSNIHKQKARNSLQRKSFWFNEQCTLMPLGSFLHLYSDRS